MAKRELHPAGTRIAPIGLHIALRATGPGAGSPSPDRFANGHEHDPSGREVLTPTLNQYFWTKGAAPDPDGFVELQVSYAQSVQAHRIRFIEGDHLAEGGWFETIDVQVRSGNTWSSVPMNMSEQLDPVPDHRLHAG